MVTIDDVIGPYATSPDLTDERRNNIVTCLPVFALLEQEMVADNVDFPVNPKTGTGISGEGNGGFRPQDCPIGAPDSSHKEGLAIDRYDPNGEIDGWLMLHQDRLEFYGIYIEHPSATTGWSHWTTRAPGSGHHVFYP